MINFTINYSLICFQNNFFCGFEGKIEKEKYQ